MQQELITGSQIAGFRVEERIGRGGMATVYRALQPSVNRAVALKVIRLDGVSAEDEEFRRRFAQEANLIASLEHIHILPVIDYGIDGDFAYLAMRLLRGGTLADLLRSGPPERERGADIFTQAARGLAYAHRHNVIHRDLKPSNILFDDTGNAYLTDFGLAKLMESSVELTRDGHIVGTPAYMSPEQLRGETLDPRSDIYSMGVILYHIVAGRAPFESSDTNMAAIIYDHLEKAPVPPRQLDPELPAAIEEVILKALQKRPADRYQTIDEMIQALNAALGRPAHTSSSPAIPVSAPAQPVSETTEVAAGTPPTAIAQRAGEPPKPARRRVLWVGLAAAGLVLALIVIGLAARSNQPASVISHPTSVPESVGLAIDIIPTSAEMAQAITSLGDQGFIANIACTQDSEYHATQIREMRDLALEHGLDFRVYDSGEDPYRQITLIERARTDGAEALIVCPLDITLLTGALASAQQAGIPIVFLAANIPSFGGVLISGDDYEMGIKAGRAGGDFINEMFEGQGRILILDYPEMEIIVDRVNGLRAGALEIAPDSVVVDSRLGGTRQLGYESVKAALEEGLDFNTILSLNDAGTFGAIQALEEAGIDPATVAISSVDGEALAREYIRQGHFLRASVSVDREMIARTAINATIRLLAGAAMPETLIVPPGPVITAANVDDVN
ncbi:MAG: protein kinase [Anaerolineae bacterium]|nr:protein kinase [Anaerolineae bacterium]